MRCRTRATLLWGYAQSASVSIRGINIIVPYSAHYIQYDKPQVVIEPIGQTDSIAVGEGSPIVPHWVW